MIIYGFIIGTVLGSFVEAVSNRLIKQTSIMGRSYCEKCKKTLSWYDLFPVVSYLLLRGKCRFCHKKITKETFLGEVLMGVAVALLFLVFVTNIDLFLNPTWQSSIFYLSLLFKLFVVCVLAIVFIVDLKTGLILDKITYPAVAISSLYLLLSTGLRTWFFYQETIKSSLGVYLLPPYSSYFIDIVRRMWVNAGGNFLTGIGLALVFAILIIITKGRGMGWGDVKYVLFLGLALGFPNALVGIMLAFLIGAVFSIFLILFGRKHFGQTIPFGPFLSLGAFIALLWGSQLLNWYLNSFKLGY